MSLPLAHLGHWWGQIVFAAPVLILVGVLLYDKVRSRGRGRQAGRRRGRGRRSGEAP